MSSWVIYNVLAEDEVYAMSDELLAMFVKASSSISIIRVNEYIKANENGNDMQRCVAEKLKAAYASVNDAILYRQSVEARKLTDELNSLQFSDINIKVDTDTLKRYRSEIIKVFSEDEDVRRLYINDSYDENELELYRLRYSSKERCVTSEDKANAITSICAYGQTHPEEEWICRNLINRMQDKKCNGAFVDLGSDNVKSTIFARVRWRKALLMNIVKSIDFLLEKKEKGIDPKTWRRC